LQYFNIFIDIHVWFRVKSFWIYNYNSLGIITLSKRMLKVTFSWVTTTSPSKTHKPYKNHTTANYLILWEKRLKKKSIFLGVQWLPIFLVMTFNALLEVPWCSSHGEQKSVASHGILINLSVCSSKILKMSNILLQ
jgi:hypothetical protein